MELLRKSLVVKCAERGLVRLEGSSLLAFPTGLLPNDTLKYTGPDGKKTRVQVLGERSVRRQGVSVKYRYHLEPAFFVRDDIGDTFTAQLKVRVHLTDLHGKPLPKRMASSRRKSLFRSWYNHEWFARTLALAAFLADGKEQIAIGNDSEEQILIEAKPLAWESPMSIDEDALEPIVWEEDEVLPGRFDNDDGEEDEGDEEEAV